MLSLKRMFIKYVTVTQKSYKEGTKIKLTHCVKFPCLIKNFSLKLFEVRRELHNDGEA
jgi:hypothetical protein